ncbi:hypothetical protein QU41_14565 [Bradyrhizobium elkanii]|nr:hypothetical protein QU41_14565 [Bradyrhizobium elkanii]
MALTQELPLEIENADAFAANILTGRVACAGIYTGNDAHEDFLAAIPSILPILISSRPWRTARRESRLFSHAGLS